MKSASALERAAAIDTVVFDKTGRRTLGAPRLLGDGIDPAVLREAAELAARSRHPLCRALIAACPDAEPAGDVEEMPGAGLRRRTTAGEWRLGHARFAGAVAGPADDCSELWFTRPGQRPLRLRFRDSLRDDAAAALAGLRATGDRKSVV